MFWIQVHHALQKLSNQPVLNLHLGYMDDIDKTHSPYPALDFDESPALPRPPQLGQVRSNPLSDEDERDQADFDQRRQPHL